ncbi:hypothetical protein GIB67_038399 [Kingdonia uniflora]|uniref:RING-type domain-containing protein n=1 Tax=Kingdonia uniflora TaxID=39325 RepID=A0A7J7NPM3_9MAGN|nr:hypothetical protein GIB67_038399 [Kingdonia uniflora]
MGSSSSKYGASSSSVVKNQSIGRRTRVFQISCLGGGSSGSYETDDNDDQAPDKENRSLSHGAMTCSDHPITESVQVDHECCRKVKDQQQPVDEVPCICSAAELNEWSQESVTASFPTSDNSSVQSAPSRSLFSLSRLRSRFSSIPGNISFRLSRAASLGSSRAYSLFSNGLTASNTEEGYVKSTNSASSSVNIDENHRDSSSSDALRLGPMTSQLLNHLPNEDTVSTQDVARNNENAGFLPEGNVSSPRNHTDRESIETRVHFRRSGDREPLERSVQFSRTLSVGRLRDRVLRRASFPEELFGRLQEDRGLRDSSQDIELEAHGGTRRTPASNRNSEISPGSPGYPQPLSSDTLYNSQDDSFETPRPRETRFQDIMEHRTDFLERRRRIRSQVRALQRLGGRFENFSGHERSCILSGQHRTGRCTCQSSNRGRNPDSDTSARASISRIVMLAEALFEVLDEIHQQSVVLSSRPSVSSIGSVPAPKEVVESMPVKSYTKLQKHQNEDEAQCYICLLEYEEEDSIRILPCRHEFHLTCIDKWLKEIHRVCPLCRGDVCVSSDSLTVENCRPQNT